MPLLPYYKKKNLLFSIDGLAKIDDVANEVEELIKKWDSYRWLARWGEYNRQSRAIQWFWE